MLFVLVHQFRNSSGILQLYCSALLLNCSFKEFETVMQVYPALGIVHHFTKILDLRLELLLWTTLLLYLETLEISCFRVALFRFGIEGFGIDIFLFSISEYVKILTLPYKYSHFSPLSPKPTQNPSLYPNVSVLKLYPQHTWPSLFLRITLDNYLHLIPKTQCKRRYKCVYIKNLGIVFIQKRLNFRLCFDSSMEKRHHARMHTCQKRIIIETTW